LILKKLEKEVKNIDERWNNFRPIKIS
jgi:hypothetical protein